MPFNPLGIRSGIIYKGTRVIQKANNNVYVMPETLHDATLLVTRSSYYEFVYKRNTYLIHPDNVTFK